MKILIADDEKDIRTLVKMTLEKKGYTVYEASDGIEALEILLQESMDMAILDVLMPELDGFSLLRQIRKRSNLPVMFLTAKIDEMDKVKGLELGADDYLEKPFGMKELVARVEAALRRTNTYDAVKKEESIINCGQLQLDVNACTLRKNGEVVPLNPKEYRLLEYLMKHQGTIFTKKALYENVWEDEYCYDDNTIMVTISRLRSKIEDDSQKVRYIHTVKGLGYKFQKVGDM